MEENQDKNREPFKPERTPEPPQQKDPRKLMSKTGEDKSPASTDEKTRKENPGKEKEKPKLLGESETEIDDETTI